MGDIQHSFSIAVGDELKISDRRTVPVDGYSTFEVTVEDGKSKKVKDALPYDESASGDEQTAAIQCLVIQADEYSEDLKFAVRNKSGGSPDYRGLTQPVVVTGQGAVAAFGIAKDWIQFENKTGAPRKIEVVVGRKTS